VADFAFHPRIPNRLHGCALSKDANAKEKTQKHHGDDPEPKHDFVPVALSLVFVEECLTSRRYPPCFVDNAH